MRGQVDGGLSKGEEGLVDETNLISDVISHYQQDACLVGGTTLFPSPLLRLHSFQKSVAFEKVEKKGIIPPAFQLTPEDQNATARGVVGSGEYTQIPSQSAGSKPFGKAGETRAGGRFNLAMALVRSDYFNCPLRLADPVGLTSTGSDCTASSTLNSSTIQEVDRMRMRVIWPSVWARL